MNFLNQFKTPKLWLKCMWNAVSQWMSYKTQSGTKGTTHRYKTMDTPIDAWELLSAINTSDRTAKENVTFRIHLPQVLNASEIPNIYKSSPFYGIGLLLGYLSLNHTKLCRRSQQGDLAISWTFRYISKFVLPPSFRSRLLKLVILISLFWITIYCLKLWDLITN